jgi:hypothetical protein
MCRSPATDDHTLTVVGVGYDVKYVEYHTMYRSRIFQPNQVIKDRDVEPITKIEKFLTAYAEVESVALPSSHSLFSLWYHHKRCSLLFTLLFIKSELVFVWQSQVLRE